MFAPPSEGTSFHRRSSSDRREGDGVTRGIHVVETSGNAREHHAHAIPVETPFYRLKGRIEKSTEKSMPDTKTILSWFRVWQIIIIHLFNLQGQYLGIVIGSNIHI